MAAMGGEVQMGAGDATLTERVNAPDDADQVGSDPERITWKPFSGLADLRRHLAQERDECDQSYSGTRASRVADHPNQWSGDDL